MRPRHTAEKGARARAPSRTASWLLPVPCSRRELFPPSSPHFALRRRVRGSEGRIPYVPLPHQRLEKRRNSKGCSLTPFLAKTFRPQLAQSFDPPTRCKRAKVCGLDQTTTVPEGGGSNEESPLVLYVYAKGPWC